MTRKNCTEQIPRVTDVSRVLLNAQFFRAPYSAEMSMKLDSNTIVLHILRMWDYAWVRGAFRHTLAAALEALAMRREGP